MIDAYSKNVLTTTYFAISKIHVIEPLPKLQLHVEYHRVYDMYQVSVEVYSFIEITIFKPGHNSAIPYNVFHNINEHMDIKRN